MKILHGSFLVIIILLCLSNVYTQDNSAPPLKKIWEFNNDEQFSHFIIRHNTLYYSTLNSFGAIDINTGSLLWKKQITEGYSGTYIASDERNLYVTTGDGRLIVYDINTFEQLWGRPIRTQIGSMAIIGNKLICIINDGILSAINTETHDLIWKADLKILARSKRAPKHLRMSIEPIIKQNSLIISTYTGEIMALNPATGIFQWHNKLCEPDERCWATGMTVSENKLFFTRNTGGIVALHFHNGRVAWEFSLKYYTMAPVLSENNMVIMTARNGYLYTFNATDGRLLWLHNVSKHLYPMISPPVVHKGIIYLTAEEKLFAFDGAGRQLWEWDSGENLDGHRIVMLRDGMILSGTTAFYRFSTGQPAPLPPCSPEHDVLASFAWRCHYESRVSGT
ncbi:MAG: hypothetical protein A2Y62_14375 [Candidatus Fischerbacteria bacterium RBG_13_37_8]|uniref:Pyrrolo-quinoline quinone repeat domain-containing protein n=1 Tax=Candidatus Fischerbacteria bacterium RBG_13_37_8 TaxID=1817863 RepID=A0A1F5VNL8_9BACT|nr:MAG: hypothetical protein A2Y62_14375 [Candidatus Fischerbacteria bacterium RBG_13_37_8]